jgi:hydrogenase maturation protein HypF
MATPLSPPPSSPSRAERPPRERQRARRGAAEGRRIEIAGTVQGVGFRPWVYRLAHEIGVAGVVRNDGNGVTIETFGPAAALDAFLARLRREAPPAAHIRRLAWSAIAARDVTGFTIVESACTPAARPSIPPDLATCPACLAEVMDPRDRRHRYPFTNCTHCGPRFTVATGVPYDRPATTMAPFAMCPDCRREYEDPRDRRFHAQPIACPVCGPRLTLRAGDGAPLAVDDPLRAAATALTDGAIVAVQGLGGFHLACDATSEAAVARLRARKRREAKPFAVMVPDLAAARALATIGDDEATLLAGPERPIVLLPLRGERERAGAVRPHERTLAPSVAPGLDLVGLLLPYTPLHHLLLADAGRPLVMTSGNLAEEPIAWSVEEAVAKLGAIADLLLTHDRTIAAPCEDSVVRTVAGVPTLVRRSRGFVPRAVAVARPFPEPVLALGGDLKSVACLGTGDVAWLSPHVGDLGTPEALDALALTVERLQDFVGVRAAVVAHDPHPGYGSRRFARELPMRRRIEVQHHHAHVASCMAEHGIDGPVLGLAWDGTGWGPEASMPGRGTAWGGELLLVDLHAYRRLATLRPLPLAGGETALREVWRLALAALDDAFDGEPPLAALQLFRGLDPERVQAVRRQLATRVNAPLAHGAGRWFDAAGALVLALPQARYEGEAALRLERAATGLATAAPPYPFTVAVTAEPWQVDLRPTVRALVRDLVLGRAPATVAARFHATLAAAGESQLRAALREHPGLPVVLSGGCFQNPHLVAALEGRLPDVRVLRHRQVPPGDGGLALGQAAVAAALLRREAELEIASAPDDAMTALVGNRAHAVQRQEPVPAHAGEE